ncbi:MAG TPA: DUF2510 domain-containing protein [Spirillospora sp.]
MPQPPGFYPDGQGNSRYWNGQSWTNKIATTTGWDYDFNVPSGSPPGEFWRDSTRGGSPVVGAEPPGATPAGIPAGTGGCLTGAVVLMFLPIVLGLIYLEMVRAYRWTLLVALVALTVGALVRRVRAPHRPKRRGVFVAAWLALAISTVIGFRSIPEPPPPPKHDPVAEARHLLVALGRGDRDLCDGIDSALQDKLNDHYESAYCFGTIDKIGEEIDERELQQLANLQITVLGKRTHKYAVQTHPTTYFRVRLAPNPLGWKEMEFAHNERDILTDVVW